MKTPNRRKNAIQARTDIMRRNSPSIPPAGSKPAPGTPQVRVNRPGPSLVPTILLGLTILASAGTTLGQTPIPKTEPELLSILRSDAPEAHQARACENLS